MTEKTIERIVLDPHLETGDSDLDDNHYPRRTIENVIRLEKRPKDKNPMQEAAERESKE